MESKVPWSGRLFKTTYGPCRTTDFVFLTLWYKTNVFIHVDLFLKVTIKECGLYVYLKQLEVQMGNQS